MSLESLTPMQKRLYYKIEEIQKEAEENNETLVEFILSLLTIIRQQKK
jgi:hypothetical protein